MSKFHGFIGVSRSDEIAEDVYKDVVEERPVRGDIAKKVYKYSTIQNGFVKDIEASLTLSFVAPLSLFDHGTKIIYVRGKIGGIDSKWEVTSIDAEQRPRLILTIGGVYVEQSE